MAGRGQCSSRSTITPNKTCSVNLYRRIKRRVGCSLKQAYCKRELVPSRKQAAYKLLRTKSGLFGLERVPRSLLRQDVSCSNRQHHSGVIHEQGRRHEVGPTWVQANAGVRSMLGRTKTSDINQTGQQFSCTLTQLSF